MISIVARATFTILPKLLPCGFVLAGSFLWCRLLFWRDIQPSPSGYLPLLGCPCVATNNAGGAGSGDVATLASKAMSKSKSKPDSRAKKQTREGSHIATAPAAVTTCLRATREYHRGATLSRQLLAEFRKPESRLWAAAISCRRAGLTLVRGRDTIRSSGLRDVARRRVLSGKHGKRRRRRS
jgi:hypothetical protein